MNLRMTAKDCTSFLFLSFPCNFSTLYRLVITLLRVFPPLKSTHFNCMQSQLPGGLQIYAKVIQQNSLLWCHLQAVQTMLVDLKLRFSPFHTAWLCHLWNNSISIPQPSCVLTSNALSLFCWSCQHWLISTPKNVCHNLIAKSMNSRRHLSYLWM